MPCAAGNTRPVPCSAQRAAAGSVMQQATRDTRDRHPPLNPPLPANNNKPRKEKFLNNTAVCAAHWLKSYSSGKAQMHASARCDWAQYPRVVEQALAPPCRPTRTARGTHLGLRRAELLGLQHRTRPSAEWAERRTRTAFALYVRVDAARAYPPSLFAVQYYAHEHSWSELSDGSSSSRATCCTL